MRFVEKCCRAGQATWHYGACALHAEYPRLQTHTDNMHYLLLLHRNYGCTNAPSCYVLCTLAVLLEFSYVVANIYRVSQEECARLREGVPYVKVYRYNAKHLCPKLNGYGDNGQRSLKL